MKLFTKEKAIDALFLIFIIISIILKFKSIFLEEINEITNLNTISLSKYIILNFIVSIVYITINRCYIIIPYFFYKLYIINYVKEKVNYKNFYKKKIYYRNIIDDYSPSVLSYIDDFRLVYPKDIVATLLNLKRKKKIDNFNLDIKNTNNIKCDDYKNVDDYILKNYNNNTLNLCFDEVRDIVIKESISLGLIKESKTIKEENKKKLKKINFIYFAIFILFIITTIFGNLIFNSSDIFIIYIFVCLLFLILFFPLIIVFYTFPIIKNLNIYVRTEKGEEVHKKLEGLKNYLKEFSRLNEKSSKELLLWDSYLIYSVIFNQNEKVVKEIEKKLSYL